MTPREEEFLKRLRATFRMEAAEHLQTMAVELLNLEKEPLAPRNPTRYETIFRTAHSLKGASRAVSAKDVELVCQALESIFAGWKQGTLSPTAKSFDVLYKAVDLITGLVHSLGGKQSAVMASAVVNLLSALEVLTIGAASPSNSGVKAGPDRALDLPPAANPAPVGDHASPRDPSLARPVERSGPRPLETVRIAGDKLEHVLQEVEELLTLKQAAKQRVGDLSDIRARFVEWEQEWSKFQLSLRALCNALPRQAPEADPAPDDPLSAATRLIDFLEWNSAHLKSLDSLIVAAHVSAKRDGHAAAKMVNGVINGTKRLVMIPVSTITDSLPLLVRQLGREKGKEINLMLSGGEVEMDKRILDGLKDPLIHLVRNAIDHGVESPQDRRRCGKPASATLAVTVAMIDDSKVEVSIRDDGAGIDPERVKRAAVKKGVISAEGAMDLSEFQAISLIFQSEVTTSSMVTDISGRGLGLAIVKEETEKLGGTVIVETNLGKDTRFRLVLPITLAAFRGLLVRVLDRNFILPVTSIERVALVKTTDIRTVENRETISFKGRAVSLVRLAEVLEISNEQAGTQPSVTLPVVILGTSDARVAFAVDEVLHDEEVLVKSLAPPLLRVRNVAGATVLSSGKLVPVLNPSDLLKSARKIGAGGHRTRSESRVAGIEQKPKWILVAEDSITSRTLIKGILESAGYRVKTVVNGVQALEALRSGTFDLVVSDVEMPCMNGFDLTARIRAERRMAEIPVVLVTALSSPEDRERGIDVGASAYIVKSDFDQSNLLDIVRRLA
jgi:two-component system chemotaxis sensor kinase CheA